jgi:hypothetical protein
MQAQIDALTEEVNAELGEGNWLGVVTLTAELYACAVAAGDEQLAELVQDLHWIANDALVHPLEVGGLLAP